MKFSSVHPHLVDLNLISNKDSCLSIIESSRHCGFYIKRQYFLKNSGIKITRGFHSHKILKQFMVCLEGKTVIKLEGLRGKYEFSLNSVEKGIFIPPGYWRDVELSPNTILSVLASEEYDESDYIRDYSEFQSWLENQRNLE